MVVKDKDAKIKEMQAIAKSRGGKCISKKYVNSDTKLEWQCAEEHRLSATGADGSISDCHGNCHVSAHESVLSGASGCDEPTTSSESIPKDKPRNGAGLCESVQGTASKRVKGFEPSTFTLATCNYTDLTQSKTLISGDSEKTVMETVTSSEHDGVLDQLNQNWDALPEHIKLAIQALIDTA